MRKVPFGWRLHKRRKRALFLEHLEARHLLAGLVENLSSDHSDSSISPDATFWLGASSNEPYLRYRLEITDAFGNPVLTAPPESLLRLNVYGEYSRASGNTSVSFGISLQGDIRYEVPLHANAPQFSTGFAQVDDDFVDGSVHVRQSVTGEALFASSWFVAEPGTVSFSLEPSQRPFARRLAPSAVDFGDPTKVVIGGQAPPRPSAEPEAFVADGTTLRHDIMPTRFIPRPTSSHPIELANAFDAATGVLHVDAAHGLLANDTLPDGATISIAQQAYNGTVTIHDDGSFEY
jgi:hypothetical protein